MALLPVSFQVKAADTDETIAPGTHPADAVVQLAVKKAAAVFHMHPDAIVIGADTVVSIDGTILGKPKDAAEAKEMLTRLSDRVHDVYTGVAIVTKEGTDSFFVQTEVEFLALGSSAIERYIASGDPFDKAGSYGIQTGGALFVKRISGDYYNVVGLPVSMLAEKLSAKGLF